MDDKMAPRDATRSMPFKMRKRGSVYGYRMDKEHQARTITAQLGETVPTRQVRRQIERLMSHG